ncbi:DUF3761 domain-containing protein [Streptomyces sp. CB01580]|uniref:DUF3761 domain-containing protein n=1 Tax=Streptomyces sp. CB01580 TaxID=1703933 RepID=UPI0009A0FAE8|nr:DUF3761 domain-containing protein [Streptomyces sp. CB01580]
MPGSRWSGKGSRSLVRTRSPARPSRVCRVGSPHPAGAIAQCNDGTYSYAAKFRGTCSHHGGVRYWYK